MISDLQAEGKSVIMVGDGINDANPYDCRYHIAMGSRRYCESSMVLMKPNLMDVVKALKISQATITTIKRTSFGPLSTISCLSQ
ncbi:MAG: hypothetical protein ACLS5K_07610 [Streptococcus salivarius]